MQRSRELECIADLKYKKVSRILSQQCLCSDISIIGPAAVKDRPAAVLLLLHCRHLESWKWLSERQLSQGTKCLVVLFFRVLCTSIHTCGSHHSGPSVFASGVEMQNVLRSELS
jgi:hypothetical protein